MNIEDKSVAKMGRWASAVIISTLSLALIACVGPSTTAESAGAITHGGELYVSLGDSYAAGYRPVAGGAGSTTTDGFAYQVAAHTRDMGKPLALVNFGCSGITSTRLRGEPGCEPSALGPGAPAYPGQSQADAAIGFLTQHRDRIGLITVIVGGNDIRPCIQAPDGSIRPDVKACVTAAVAVLRDNLSAVLSGIRAAAGPDVPVVGLTYPDIYLGAWLSGAHDVAAGSVVLFRDMLNTALKAEYTAAGAAFADITAATGGYGPLGDSVVDPVYGTIPRPVAQVCALTYICRLGDIHPTVEGHRLIAGQVLDAAHLS